MTEALRKGSLLSQIIAGIIVLAVMSITTWVYREERPDWSLLVAAWILIHFTVCMTLHLRKMRRHRGSQSTQQD